MRFIDSPHNPKLKLYRTLLRNKGRQQTGLCPLEGVRLIEAAVESGVQIYTAYLCPELADDPRTEVLIARLRVRGVEMLELSRRAFESMAETQHPQGIAATAAMNYHSLADLSRLGPAYYLWLHEIREPGNLGTLLRTAAAFSATGVVLVGECTDPYNPKAIRASAGAVFAVPVARSSWDQAQHWAASEQVQTVASAAEAPLSCHQATYPDRVALVIGSEAHGLPDDLLTATDLQVKIPISDKVESLNAGVAAGILLYTIAAQHNSTGPDSPDKGSDGEE